MIRSALIKLGANYVVEIERDDESPGNGPRLVFYRMEVFEDLTPEKAEAVAAALVRGEELPRS